MKFFLLTAILFACFSKWAQLNAQCTVSNPTITNVTRVSNGGGTCTLKFDLSFTMQNNNGNKTIVIHLWPGNSYPNPAICYIGGGCGQPSAAQLAGSYGSIVINNDPVSPSYYSVYPFISGVNILPTNAAIVRTGGGTNAIPFNFTLKEITIAGVPCSGGIIIKGDIWSTNSGSLNSNTNPQCATSGIYLGVGDPTIAGFKNCSIPRQLLFGVSTTSVSPITVTYKIYKSDGNTSFDPSTDLDVTLPGSDPITVSAATSPQSRTVGFAGNDVVGEHYDYWIVVAYTPPGASAYNVAYLVPNGGCSTLPVEFTSFTAKRQGSAVLLSWETSSEVSNNGFSIERSTTGGQWEALAFIKSQAAGGNSSATLLYKYTDNNNLTAQYRIRQVDIDGKSKYSSTVLVNGFASAGNIKAYPNPSQDGVVNLLFEGTQTSKNITVIDASGKAISRWNNVIGNNLRVDNLAPGFYSILVVSKETGVQAVVKVVVSKR